jgi:hypothetical protein
LLQVGFLKNIYLLTLVHIVFDSGAKVNVG